MSGITKGEGLDTGMRLFANGFASTSALSDSSYGARG